MLAIMLATVVAAPVAAMGVLVEWVRLGPYVDTVSPAMWSARTFMPYFDASASLLFLPSVRFLAWVQAKAAGASSRREWYGGD